MKERIQQVVLAAFKCRKCGATFEDEGDYAIHAQTCKG